MIKLFQLSGPEVLGWSSGGGGDGGSGAKGGWTWDYTLFQINLRNRILYVTGKEPTPPVRPD